MKLRKKTFGFIVGIMIMISITALRFGKHLKPRQSDTIIELAIKSFDDVGKIQSITKMLSEKTDSVESIRFLNCLNDLNFLKSSYPLAVEKCYKNALNEANRNNSTFSEVIIRTKKSLDEMIDNHHFIKKLDGLIRSGQNVNFDNTWKDHFKRPSQIDMDYKPLMKQRFKLSMDIKRSLNSSSSLFKQLDSLKNKEDN